MQQLDFLLGLGFRVLGLGFRVLGPVVAYSSQENLGAGGFGSTLEGANLTFQALEDPQLAECMDP